MEFAGQVVVIAGASSGIGRAVVVRLAEQGAHVVAVARRADRLAALQQQVQSAGGRCWTECVDLGDEEACAALIDRVVKQHGRIDAVLLNAGGAPDIDLRAVDAAQVKSYMHSNYDVVVNVLFPVLTQMRRQGHGLVAHTNSLAGFAGIPLQGPYSAAKAAARMLLDTCRLEFADDGIRFVTIYPGFVATESTAADNMPAPLEISEAQAARSVVRAMRTERWDYAFPMPVASLVRILRVVPKPVAAWYLRAELRKARAGLPQPAAT